jgi:ubiquinone/menaquinone biosynthesis C-methylase UbiE
MSEAPVNAPQDAERRQSTHYDEIATEYDRHYSDETSERYRERFVNGPMTAGIDLQGRDVLEAMCGSGSTAQYLLSKGGRLSGLDISPTLMQTFKQKWPAATAICGSILDTGLPDASFDCVFVVGGLHHVQPHLDPAIDEIYRILRPGGYFCFAEPHARSFPDMVRRLWYKVDRLFERNEEAIDVNDLKSKNAGRFDFITTKYSGNLAYLLVYNSMVFRVPLRWKRFYASPLLSAEAAINRVLSRGTSCFVVCQWRKKPASAA